MSTRIAQIVLQQPKRFKPATVALAQDVLWQAALAQYMQQSKIT